MRPLGPARKSGIVPSRGGTFRHGCPPTQPTPRGCHPDFNKSTSKTSNGQIRKARRSLSHRQHCEQWAGPQASQGKPPLVDLVLIRRHDALGG